MQVSCPECERLACLAADEIETQWALNAGNFVIAITALLGRVT